MDHPRNKSCQVNIRISEGLRDQIDALADVEGRTRANWAERELEKAVARRGKKKSVDRRVARG